jgi:hypothetical protein
LLRFLSRRFLQLAFGIGHVDQALAIGGARGSYCGSITSGF